MATNEKSTLRKTLLIATFASFATYSTWVMWEIGYTGIWQAGISDIGSIQILWDLVIACALFCFWVKGDAEARGVNPYPWIVGTVCTGTIAPLAYLITREFSSKKAPQVATNLV